MRAYLGEGELISDHGTLRRLAVEAGLPGDRVGEMLGGDEFADRVAGRARLARLAFGAASLLAVEHSFQRDQGAGGSGRWRRCSKSRGSASAPGTPSALGA